MSMNVGNAAGEDEVMVEMNTTPLIDVMLVMLTLLILTLPPQTHAVKLDMPQPNQPPPLVTPVSVDLGVDFDGTITWNGDAVNRARWIPIWQMRRIPTRSRKFISIPTGLPNMISSPRCWPMPSGLAPPILVLPELTSITKR